MSGDRADYIRGLRDLAGILEQNDDLPLPYQGSKSGMTFHYLGSPDPVTEMITAMQAIPCGFTSEISVFEDDDGRGNAYLDLHGELHGVKIALTAYRKKTCTQDEDGVWRIPDAITSRAPEAEATA